MITKALATALDAASTHQWEEQTDMGGEWLRMELENPWPLDDEPIDAIVWQNEDGTIELQITAYEDGDVRVRHNNIKLDDVDRLIEKYFAS
jgi:hypothetical protein